MIISIFPSYRYYGTTSSDINQRDILFHIRYLSDDSLEGRLTGTSGSKKARIWIVSFYRRWGFYPIFGNHYTQEFTFYHGKKYKKGKQNYIEIPDCKDKCKIPIEPIPLGKPGKIQGKIIKGNYCLESNGDLSKTISKIDDPKNYIIICRRYGPDDFPEAQSHTKQLSFRSKYKQIEKLGFRGVIFLQDSGNPIKTEQFYVRKKGNTIAIFFNNQKYKNFYNQYLLENKTIYITTEFSKKQIKGKNLGFALFPYNQNQNVIYIGAHYDHLGKGIPHFSLGKLGEIYNGADDNASGTALVMELAEYFQNWKKKHTFPPDWNLIFLHFDAEEWGLIGSYYFVHSQYFNPNAIAMLNFDMVGRLQSTLQIQGLYTGGKTWQNMIRMATQSFIQNKIQIHYLKGGLGPSDHSSFYRKKIPVLFIFTGNHSDYHKPTDDYEKLNFSGIQMIGDFAKNLILQMIHSRTIPRYRKAKEIRSRSITYRVRLGIIPANYFSGDGVEVGGFIEGAPIQKSGVKEGDIIIQIENFRIRSIYDLTEFLSRAHLEKTYTLYYKRNHKVYKTKIRLIGM